MTLAGAAWVADDGAGPEHAVPAAPRLGQRALLLGAANAFDVALQFLLPVVLVRCLDAEAFGEYRLLWLVAGTVLGVATLAMPQSLYYYLPRSDATAKRLYVNQTLAFLAIAGLAAAWAVSSWNPLLPEKLRLLARHELILPAFIVLWVVASLLDMLPTAEERVRWQAQATVGLAVLRAVSLSLAAVLTRELGPVLVVLLAFVAIKVLLLLVYVARHHGLRGPVLRPGAFADQLRYAAPFGAAGALYILRTQSDQWVAAALFPLGLFAAFSIAAVLGPLMNLFRQSVNYAFLPVMSRRHAVGDIAGMLALNSRGNIMVGALVFPLFALAFVLAEDLVTLVYTAAYLDAAPVIRVCIVGIAALAIELSSVTLLLRQSVFVMLVNIMALVLAVSLNWYAALNIGLAGAALGTVAVIYLDRLVTLWRIARIAGIPIRRLQDWTTLALLLAFAMLSALLAWATIAGVFAASGPLVRLLVGAAVMAAAYAALVAGSHTGRDTLAALRGRPHGT
ncbi:MAG TPA: oligosaccharide flippase family protein [Burkholderiales bacterium]|nr:oligosaccharide flippase family protein [Burkholderiales bacterium]